MRKTMMELQEILALAELEVRYQILAKSADAHISGQLFISPAKTPEVMLRYICFHDLRTIGLSLTRPKTSPRPFPM